MYYNSTILANNKLKSVIDGCNLKEAFGQVLNCFDPNKHTNLKTNVLDVTNCYIWNEDLFRKFNVTKTNNLTGYVLENTYDIILYECPYNKNFLTHVNKYIPIFKTLLEKHSVIICRSSDFKDKNNRLKGTENIKQVFKNNGFYIDNQIIYKNPISYNKNEIPDNNPIDINHSYFTIFK